MSSNNNFPKKVLLFTLGICTVFVLPYLLFTRETCDVVHFLLLVAFICCGFLYYLWMLYRNWRQDYWQGVESESAYAILGVDFDATSEEIRRAYRALAAKYHPDKVRDDQKEAATKLLLRINRAYEMLGDEDSRFEHDSMLCHDGSKLPPFDEIYAEFLQRRAMSPSLAEGDEYWMKTPSWADEQSEEFAKNKAFKNDEIPERQPSSTHDDEATSLIPVHTSETGRSPTPVPETSAASSDECPACGEPYLRLQGRAGAFLCERCGEQLPS